MPKSSRSRKTHHTTATGGPGSSSSLPPGQRRRRDFPRFSHHRKRPPAVASAPEVLVVLPSGHEFRVPVHRLEQAVPRVEQVADFHCVAGWSSPSLTWSGFSFGQFWAAFVEPRCARGQTAGIVVHGQDGVVAALDLRDALGHDVLLADRLDGAPLDPAHGAPLRLVTPGQYGYKNIKHVARIEVCATLPDPGRGRHLRARVEHEERHPRIRGRLLRLPYRLAIPLIIRMSRLKYRPEDRET
ncbi:molybdopterin-dependent oxidoreductase [Prauserella cavernicola]|uniref:Molybdopterin-dependent oxidoreductase n=1 Tax=Prauserella cavernicola TaxID=2800127 RepID=A0A934QW84_9PSEU|nr:molybdopterin-dependent oxidoreductase [Prauserella cavernicola]MBK1786458.1 molybdopterin-dependent oxidoreductase [Prauserella cavernicola]